MSSYQLYGIILHMLIHLLEEWRANLDQIKTFESGCVRSF